MSFTIVNVLCQANESFCSGGLLAQQDNAAIDTLSPPLYMASCVCVGHSDLFVPLLCAEEARYMIVEDANAAGSGIDRECNCN